VKHVKPEIFTAKARIVLNGKAHELVGRGTIDVAQGTVDGQYEHDIPANDLDARIFQTVLITGYPSVCRDNGIFNPFKAGNYVYHREVDFGSHGKLSYEARCKFTNSDESRCLESEFDVTGNIATPPLKSALPVTEQWFCERPGEIASRFDILWPTRVDGVFVTGRATTRYSPSFLDFAPVPCRRQIVFHKADVKMQSLKLIQESWLVSGAPQ
jgi:hypothetical protein